MGEPERRGSILPLVSAWLSKHPSPAQLSDVAVPQQGGLRLGSAAYKALMADLLKIEAATGVPVSELGRKALSLVTSESDIPGLLADVHTLVTRLPLPGEGTEDTEGTEGTGGAGGMVQTGGTAILPPIIEMLTLMQTRRQDAKAAAQAYLTSILGIGPVVPSGATQFPGFESGGLADVMMGFITGKGKESYNINDPLRAINRVPIDMSMLDLLTEPEPTVEAEMGAASALAQQILGGALHLPSYGFLSGEEEVDEDALLEASIQSILSGAAPATGGEWHPPMALPKS